MHSTLAIWTLVGLSALGQAKNDPAKPGQKPVPPPRPTYAFPELFRLVPIEEAKLSSTKPGMITKLNVVDGVEVEQNEVLGQIDDRESQANIKQAQAELEVARKQASSDAPVQAAIATLKVSEAELKKSTDINEKRAGAVNEIEIERQRLTVTKSQHQIAVAQQEFEVAGLNVYVKAAQLEVAELDAELRKFRAPYSCEVVQVIRHVGEWVREGEPVLHVVKMDRLRVQGYLSTKHSPDDEADDVTRNAKVAPVAGEMPAVDPSEILGRECEVTLQLPKGKTEVFRSKIGFVSPIAEAGVDEVRVWIEIENKKVNGRWIAQPGQNASVKVILDPPPKPKVDPKAPAAKPAAAGAPVNSGAPPVNETPKAQADKP